MKAKIIETFQSIQGEGKYQGIKQIFVRFFECNMHCVWCDTPHSIGDDPKNNRYEEFTADELFQTIASNARDCHSVSLTGGEPLLQADFIKTLIPFLKEHRMKIYLETNGVLPDELKKIINDIDIIAMDIKLPSSTKCQNFFKEHEEFLKIALAKEVFIKTVISSDTKKEDIEKSVALVLSVNKDLLFILQPNYFEMKNGVMSKCQEFQDYCLNYLSDVRILPQVHKFMKVR